MKPLAARAPIKEVARDASIAALLFTA